MLRHLTVDVDLKLIQRHLGLGILCLNYSCNLRNICLLQLIEKRALHEEVGTTRAPVCSGVRRTDLKLLEHLLVLGLSSLCNLPIPWIVWEVEYVQSSSINGG